MGREGGGVGREDGAIVVEFLYDLSHYLSKMGMDCVLHGVTCIYISHSGLNYCRQSVKYIYKVQWNLSLMYSNIGMYNFYLFWRQTIIATT